jgi:hypothetical protein
VERCAVSAAVALVVESATIVDAIPEASRFVRFPASIAAELASS